MTKKTKTNIIADEELLNLIRVKAALQGITLTEAMERAISDYVADIRPDAEALRKKLDKS